MRIRTIKPEFWVSESVGQMSRDTRLLFVGLWNLADDHGRFRADPRYVAGQLFPYDPDGSAISSRGLAELSGRGCVALYEVGGSRYGHVTGWDKHQKIDKRATSRLPAPEEGQPVVMTVETVSPPIPRDNSGKSSEPSPIPREELVLDLVPRNREQGTGNREVSPQAAIPKESRGKPEKPGTAPDSRHAPTLKSLVDAFAEVRGVPLSVDGRTAKDVARLLAKGEPDEVLRRWRLALAEPKYPKVATPGELCSHWDHWAGTRAAVIDLRRPQPAATFSQTRAVEDF